MHCGAFALCVPENVWDQLSYVPMKMQTCEYAFFSDRYMENYAIYKLTLIELAISLSIATKYSYV